MIEHAITIVVIILIWHLLIYIGLECTFQFGYGETPCCLCNPIYIYKKLKVNIFGVFLLTVMFNIIQPLFAVFYWIYKLSTIGRR